MNNDEAREILLRYRGQPSDQADLSVQAALKQASLDPELAAWLEDHCEFQRAMKGQFGDLPVPKGLREQILSEKRSFVNALRPSRRVVIGGFAALLILVGLSIFYPMKGDEENRFSNFRMRMVKASQRGYAMDIVTPNETMLRKYLESKHAVSDWKTPPGLTDGPLMGGAVMTWRNQPAVMVCYGAGPKPELWLFVLKSSSVPDPPSESQVVFKRENRLNTVSWTQAGQTYILAGDKDDAGLRLMLNTGV